jgi:hypothetical protein
MRDDRKGLEALMRENEFHNRIQLFGGVLRNAKRGMSVRLFIHFRVAIGESKSVEIEPPNIEAGLAKGVPPRASAEAVGDRYCGRKGRAVNI